MSQLSSSSSSLSLSPDQVCSLEVLRSTIQAGVDPLQQPWKANNVLVVTHPTVTWKNLPLLPAVQSLILSYLLIDEAYAHNIAVAICRDVFLVQGSVDGDGFDVTPEKGVAACKSRLRSLISTYKETSSSPLRLQQREEEFKTELTQIISTFRGQIFNS